MRMLIESHYLPTLEFFCAIANADEIVIEQHEHFVKQSYRNHTFINTANGINKLVVPLADKGNRTVIKDVKLDVSQNWRNTQWRTLESAYRNAPYYEYYVDDLRKILQGKQTFLIDLNHELLSMCLNWLGWQKKISTSLTYQVTAPDIIDLRNILLSKKQYNPRSFYKPQPYTQVFGKTFVENLSLVDLIYCKGPKASSLLRASVLNH
jgi:WbqC-like protein family